MSPLGTVCVLSLDDLGCQFLREGDGGQEGWFLFVENLVCAGVSGRDEV